MNFEKKVIYTKPELSDQDKEFRHHRFTIDFEGETISGAEVHYCSKPVPHYQLSVLWTEYEFQNKGLRLASTVMDAVEAFLKERKKPGILVDSIMSDVPEVQGMYERRGWQLIDNLGRRVFNVPKDIDPSVFASYEVRAEDIGAADKWEENRGDFFKNNT